MSIEYFGVCHDCEEYIDLDKFYSWSSYSKDSDYADIDKENLDYYKNDGFIYRSLRLHFFMEKHPGHRIEVLDWDKFYDSGKKDIYKQVFHWPKAGDSQDDVIDFTDPKSGRLTIKTKHGELNIDIRSDGINCFRVDTLLLPNIKKC
jgi:hypothetical protein